MRELVRKGDVGDLNLDIAQRLCAARRGECLHRPLVLMQQCDRIDQRQILLVIAAGACPVIEERQAISVTQQMIASYEVGRRRVPVSLLPQVAATLAVSLEELIGKKDAQPAKRGPAPKLQQQIERIQKLPKSRQRFVMEMLDTVLQQADR
jgi:hypothetical protein